jgi:hypothetical protein
VVIVRGTDGSWHCYGRFASPDIGVAALVLLLQLQLATSGTIWSTGFHDLEFARHELAC